MKIILLAFLFIIVYFLKTKERFSLPQAKPLTLENSHIYDPSDWKWLYANVLTNTIKIKALTGEVNRGHPKLKCNRLRNSVICFWVKSSLSLFKGALFRTFRFNF